MLGLEEGLTTARGSKKRCSFQEQWPVPLMSSLAVVNFFSPRTVTSIRGSTVLPSGTLSCLAFSTKTYIVTAERVLAYVYHIVSGLHLADLGGLAVATLPTFTTLSGARCRLLTRGLRSRRLPTWGLTSWRR